MAVSNFSSVRCLPSGAPEVVPSLKQPFAVEGARNVFLETVKRGEYDSFDAVANMDDKSSPTTIVLRLYEAFGGHAQAKLVISSHLPVVKAFTTNLLEDEDEELYVLRPLRRVTQLGLSCLSASAASRSRRSSSYSVRCLPTPPIKKCQFFLRDH